MSAPYKVFVNFAQYNYEHTWAALEIIHKAHLGLFGRTATTMMGYGPYPSDITEEG